MTLPVIVCFERRNTNVGWKNAQGGQRYAKGGRGRVHNFIIDTHTETLTEIHIDLVPT